MRIAQISPLYEAVPPRLYGGTERVVATLCDALVDLGHEVTLFASAEAETKARLHPVRDQAIRLDPAPLKSELAAHMTELFEVRAHADEFDMLHFHTDMVHFPFFADRPERTVTTLHGRIDLKDLDGVYRRCAAFPLVSISDDQRRPMPWANFVGTVQHGLRPELYRVGEGEGDYLAFLGRISPEKGPDVAIEIAKRAGLRLKIAAKVDEVDRAYFHREIEPLLDHPLIEFVGEIGGAEKSKFLGEARALLFPVRWPEPFGLVMIEAMACGAPVIAYAAGSTPEVIEEGVTGFLVEGVDAAVQAVAAARSLDRRAIRRRFDLRFSGTVMARRYLEVYSALTTRDLPLASMA